MRSSAGDEGIAFQTASPRNGKSPRNRVVAVNGADAPAGSERHERGHLIVVSCADMGRLDLLLKAAGRHLVTQHNSSKLATSHARAALLEPVTTRLLPAGGGVVLKPSGFDGLDQAGALILKWADGSHLRGYPVSLLARLATGESVIAGVPQNLESEARSIWPQVSIIRLASGTETLRERLSPRANFARSAAGRESVPLRPLDGEPYDVRIEDSADLKLAVQRLAGAVSQRLTAATQLTGPRPPAEPVRAGRRTGGRIAAISLKDAVAAAHAGLATAGGSLICPQQRPPATT